MPVSASGRRRLAFAGAVPPSCSAEGRLQRATQWRMHRSAHLADDTLQQGPRDRTHPAFLCTQSRLSSSGAYSSSTAPRLACGRSLRTRATAITSPTPIDSANPQHRVRMLRETPLSRRCRLTRRTGRADFDTTASTARANSFSISGPYQARCLMSNRTVSAGQPTEATVLVAAVGAAGSAAA